jgi:hypothetical protein
MLKDTIFCKLLEKEASIGWKQCMIKQILEMNCVFSMNWSIYWCNVSWEKWIRGEWTQGRFQCLHIEKLSTLPAWLPINSTLRLLSKSETRSHDALLVTWKTNIKGPSWSASLYKVLFSIRPSHCLWSYVQVQWWISPPCTSD